MYVDPQDRVSEITEFTEWSRSYHFFASLGWSVLAGTAGMMLVLLISARSSLDAGAILGGLVWVAIFVAAFSLAGMVLIGLPLTFLLRTIEQETAATYAALGAIAGFLVLAVTFELPRHAGLELLWFTATGAFAGWAAARRWGRWREAVARMRHLQPEEHSAPKRSNPIHDLIH